MPAWSMGTTPKGKMLKTSSMEDPGPGAYSATTNIGYGVPRWR